MLKLPLAAVALVSIGAAAPDLTVSISTGSQVERADVARETATSIPPALLIGLDASLCTARPGNASSGKTFFQMAAAKNELKPYGQLPEGERAAQASTASSSVEQPLWDNLGTLAFPVTTVDERAQQYFNQGLRLAFAFNHAEAGRAFQMAQQIDPHCAMCHWGEALVLGPNINMPMDPAANEPAAAATAKALMLMQGTAPHEKALIQALAARYSPDKNIDRKSLDAAYADAMTKVTAQFPDDATIAVLHAEALMNLAPWDYWQAGGTQPKGRTAELVATIERALQKDPDHPGAIHYYIHTVEASDNPKRAEAYAERLGAMMPGAGHLVHMPSHIYYRVGRYKDSLAANRQAVLVDEAYIADRKPTGVYPLAYYPHNVHFVLVSAQMAGDGKTVIEAADKLSSLVSDDVARQFAMAQPVRVAPYFAHAQFGTPEAILALPEPDAGLPYVEGLWHYARGIAFAKQGDTINARKEVGAIDGIRDTGNFTALTEGGIPAKVVLQIASDVVLARIAQARGDLDLAARHFEKAAALEDQLAYMEPAYWYYPVRQSLGAVLLQKGDLAGAEQAFRASLVRVPNNGWSLYGLSEVFKKAGNRKLAAATDELLINAWAGSRDQLSLSKL